jgi:hypothetical protein
LTDQTDLTESLANAAAEAVRARRAAIEAAGAGVLQGVTVEVEIANRGAVIDVTSYLSWRQTMRGATK